MKKKLALFTIILTLFTMCKLFSQDNASDNLGAPVVELPDESTLSVPAYHADPQSQLIEQVIEQNIQNEDEMSDLTTPDETDTQISGDELNASEEGYQDNNEEQQLEASEELLDEGYSLTAMIISLVVTGIFIVIAVLCFINFEEGLGTVFLICGVVLGLLCLFVLISGWTFIYTLQFLGAGLFLLVSCIFIFSPLFFRAFSDLPFVIITVVSFVCSIMACVVTGIKMGEMWWLWKYILVELTFVAISWVFSGLLNLYEKHKDQLRIEQDCNSMARNICSGNFTPSKKDKFYSDHKIYIDFLVEKMKKEAYEASRQQKENEKKIILQEQKNVEEARNRENELSNLEKKVKSLSDNVLLFQNAVDQKEPVNLQLLKLIEDGLSIVKNTEMNLTSSLKDEVNRNLKYCRAVFEDCKNLDGYTNSSRLRMETILNLFEDILSTK